MEDFVGAKFYLADGNQRIQIRQKTLEFSSTVLSTLDVLGLNFFFHFEQKFYVEMPQGTVLLPISVPLTVYV